MNNINVTYADMHDAANRLRGGKEELMTKIQELSSMIDGLVSGGFVTDASSVAYHDTFQQFKTGATTVIDSLDGLSSFLDSAASTFEGDDTGLANQIRS